MSIPITCAGCKSTFDVPDNLAGKTIRCTSCKAQMAVPESLDAVEVEAVEVEAVEEVATVAGKKPFGSGAPTAAAKPASAKSNDTPAPKKAPAPPKPAPTAKKGPAVELDDDEEEEDDKAKTKPGKGAPAAKKPGIVGSAGKKRRDDDDDDDDKPRKKKKQAAGGSGMMIAMIAAGALALAAVAGGGIYLLSGKKAEKKPDEVAKTDDTPKPADPKPVPPGGNVENPFAEFIPFDRIGVSGAWANHMGDGFSADFPGKPEDTTQAVGGLELKFTGVGARDGAFAVAAYSQIPPEILQQASDDPKAQLNLIMFVVGKMEAFKGAAPSDITMNGHPGKVVKLKPGNAEVEFRLVVAKGRAYIFAAGGVYKDGKPTMSRTDADRFFGTIDITYTGGGGGAGGPGSPPPAGFSGFANQVQLGTPGAWSNFKGDDFTADFPGTPDIRGEAGPLGITGKTTALGRKNEFVFATMSFTAPPAVMTEMLREVGNDPQKLCETFLLATFRVKDITPTDVTLDGQIWKEVELPNATGTARAIVVKNRIVILLVNGGRVAGKPDLAQADKERFFNSVKLTAKGDPVVIGPGPMPTPGDPANPGTPADGSLKIKLDPFFTAAFDADKKDVFTLDARPNDARLKGALQRYEYPSFKLLGRYKLPQAASRCVIDSKNGLLYVATVTNLQTSLQNGQMNSIDRSTASGDISIYDLKPIRDGKTADGKALSDGAELKPVATLPIKQTINGLELSADGKTLYVLTTGTVVGTTTRKSTMVIIDTETRKESPRKPLAELAWDMTKTGDGKHLLIMEVPGKNKSASVVTFNTSTLSVTDPSQLPGTLCDIAPLTAGGAFVSAMAAQGAMPPGGGIVPPPVGAPPPGGGPNFKLWLLDAKGVTEQDLGPVARLANNGYIKLDPDNKKLFVSSFRAPGLDVYDVTDITAPNGLKLKSSIKTAGGQLVGGHFVVSPDGKTLLFHNGVVIDTDKVGGGVPGAGGPPVGPGGIVPPGMGGPGPGPGPGGNPMPPGPGPGPGPTPPKEGPGGKPPMPGGAG